RPGLDVRKTASRPTALAAVGARCNRQAPRLKRRRYAACLGIRVSAPDPTIVTIGPADEEQIAEVCELLVRSFRELSPAWVPTVEAAREKVIDALRSGMLSR